MDRHDGACRFAGGTGLDHACCRGSVSMDGALRSTTSHVARVLGSATGLDHRLWLDRHLRDARFLDRHPDRGPSDPQRRHIRSKGLARDFARVGHLGFACALQHLCEEGSCADRDHWRCHAHHLFDRLHGGSGRDGSAKYGELCPHHDD